MLTVEDLRQHVGSLENANGSAVRRTVPRTSDDDEPFWPM